MSDDDLLQTVRTQFTDVRLTSPLASVVARGSQLRRRRTWPALGAGTGTVAAVVALTVSLAASGGGPGNGAHVALDAWSVISKPGGTVSLTIRDRRESSPDRARLGQALREAGVPAVVQTSLPRGCRSTVTIQQAVRVSRHNGTVTVNIHPSKLPKRAQIAVVIPAILAYLSPSGHRTVIVQISPGAVRGLGYRVVPQVVVLGLATACVLATTSKSPGG